MRLARRWAKRAAAAAAVTLLFWAAAVAASTIPRLEPLRTNVHGLSLADYRSSPVRPLAPLSHRIIEEASRDASTLKAPAPAPGSSPSPISTPTPTPQPGPTPTPSPTPTPPLPSATPLPTPPPIVNGTIQGLVKSATTSAPLAGALIQTSGGSTSTDGSGSYRLSLAPGLYAVTASAPGYLAQTQNAAVVSGQTFQLNFALAPGSIDGMVLDSSTNVGIPQATVSLSPGGLTTTTDLSGAFTFAAVNPGTYTVSASAATYAPSTQNVTVPAGQKVKVTLKLNRSLL